MKLTILIDNNVKIDKYLLAEAGSSFYIEESDKRVLFDCGYSDAFLKNAFKLKIDLRNLTDIVLSHGHNDHTGGLFYLKQLYQDSLDLGLNINTPTITAHKNIFELKNDEVIGSCGSPLGEEQFTKICKLNLTNESFWLTPKLCFLGEVQNETIRDDSALVYTSTKGLIIITGCAHSGLKKIIEKAKQITRLEKIEAIIGGFHLLNKDEEEIKNLCEFLQKQKVNNLYPCHCVDLNAKIIMSKYFPIQDIGVGDSFVWM